MKKIILFAKVYLILMILFSNGSRSNFSAFKRGWNDGLKSEDEKLAVQNKTYNKDDYIFEHNVEQENVKDGQYVVSQIKTVNSTGKISVCKVFAFMVGIIGLFFLILTVITAFKFLNSIQKQFVFTNRNFSWLRNTAFYLFIYVVFYSVSDYLYQVNDKNSLQIMGFKSVAHFNIDYGFLSVAVCLLIVSFIIKEGIKLKEENDLTV